MHPQRSTNGNYNKSASKNIYRYFSRIDVFFVFLHKGTTLLIANNMKTKLPAMIDSVHEFKVMILFHLINYQSDQQKKLFHAPT
jgi:hypothetical protein